MLLGKYGPVCLSRKRLISPLCPPNARSANFWINESHTASTTWISVFKPSPSYVSILVVYADLNIWYSLPKSDTTEYSRDSSADDNHSQGSAFINRPSFYDFLWRIPCGRCWLNFGGNGLWTASENTGKTFHSEIVLAWLSTVAGSENKQTLIAISELCVGWVTRKKSHGVAADIRCVKNSSPVYLKVVLQL